MQNNKRDTRTIDYMITISSAVAMGIVGVNHETIKRYRMIKNKSRLSCFSLFKYFIGRKGEVIRYSDIHQMHGFFWSVVHVQWSFCVIWCISVGVKSKVIFMQRCGSGFVLPYFPLTWFYCLYCHASSNRLSQNKMI